MIPEIEITCGGKRAFINSVTTGQFKQYAALMQKKDSGGSDKGAFFDKRIVQMAFGNQFSLSELGKTEAAEFLSAAEGVHFIMWILMEKMLGILQTGQMEVEAEASAFDEYDLENGYEEEPEENRSIWEIGRDVVDNIIKTAIRLLKDSYSGCMAEDFSALLDFLQFELESANRDG